MTRANKQPPNFGSHVRDAEVEDVQFLVDNGVLFEDACKRVGVTTEAVEGRVRRA